MMSAVLDNNTFCALFAFKSFGTIHVLRSQQLKKLKSLRLKLKA